MEFREIVAEIAKNARDNGIDDSILSDAWDEAYISMNVAGAYHLWETGYEVGDACDCEIKKDAEARNIKIIDIDDPIELLNALDDEFLELYESIIEVA